MIPFLWERDDQQWVESEGKEEVRKKRGRRVKERKKREEIHK